MTGDAVRIDGPRACHESELEETVALINAVFRAGTDQDITTDYPLIFREPKLDLHRVLSVDGRIVAHVPVAPSEVVNGGDRFTIGIIGPTVTHPDHRRRGYATLCLRDATRIQEERGWPVAVLWTSEATFPFYWHSGWEAVGSQGFVYALGRGDRDLFSRSSHDVVAFDPAARSHLDLVAAAHDAEPQAHRPLPGRLPGAVDAAQGVHRAGAGWRRAGGVPGRGRGLQQAGADRGRRRPGRARNAGALGRSTGWSRDATSRRRCR